MNAAICDYTDSNYCIFEGFTKSATNCLVPKGLTGLPTDYKYSATGLATYTFADFDKWLTLLSDRSAGESALVNNYFSRCSTSCDYKNPKKCIFAGFSQVKNDCVASPKRTSLGSATAPYKYNAVELAGYTTIQFEKWLTSLSDRTAGERAVVDAYKLRCNKQAPPPTTANTTKAPVSTSPSSCNQADPNVCLFGFTKVGSDCVAPSGSQLASGYKYSAKDLAKYSDWQLINWLTMLSNRSPAEKALVTAFKASCPKKYGKKPCQTFCIPTGKNCFLSEGCQFSVCRTDSYESYAKTTTPKIGYCGPGQAFCCGEGCVKNRDPKNPNSMLINDNAFPNEC